MKKRIWTALLSLMLTLPVFAHAPVPEELKNEQHKAMHWIFMKSEDERAGCTAYAISPHVLLTAEHCNVEDGKLTLDGSPIVTPITEKVFDHYDHMLLVVPLQNFQHTIMYDPENYNATVQGEPVYTWGNPAGIRDQYREGYMMGSHVLSEPDEEIDAPANAPVFMYDFTGAPGDSGSSVFSARDGRLVVIITYGFGGGKVMGGYALHFTQAQVQEAISRK